MKKLMLIASLFLSFSFWFFWASSVLAGGGRVDMSGGSGEVGGKAARVKVTVYEDDNREDFSSGEEGEFTFVGGNDEKYCEAKDSETDSEGEIEAECFSDEEGTFTVNFMLDDGDETETYIEFKQPKPADKYSVSLSANSSTISRPINPDNTFGVSGYLRNNGEDVRELSRFTFQWSSDDTKIAKIAGINRSCPNSNSNPCPETIAYVEGVAVGSTKIRLKIKKDGTTVAETSLTYVVTGSEENKSDTNKDDDSDDSDKSDSADDTQKQVETLQDVLATRSAAATNSADLTTSGEAVLNSEATPSADQTEFVKMDSSFTLSRYQELKNSVTTQQAISRKWLKEHSLYEGFWSRVGTSSALVLTAGAVQLPWSQMLLPYLHRFKR